MSDLIERLRKHADSAVGHWEDYANKTDSLCREAADALSEAEQREKEARREALEEAARYHDYRADNHAAAHKHVVSDFHEMMEKTHRDAAADIRALIPSGPHDAEGRE